MPDNIDSYGHCVICHKNLVINRVIDNRVQTVFSPLYGTVTFLLNNGSQMAVCMCMTCKNTTDLSDSDVHDKIMEAVMNGWELEAQNLVEDPAAVKWTPEFKQKYLDTQSNLSINCYADNHSQDKLENLSQELAQNFHREIKPVILPEPVSEVIP